MPESRLARTRAAYHDEHITGFDAGQIEIIGYYAVPNRPVIRDELGLVQTCGQAFERGAWDRCDREWTCWKCGAYEHEHQ